MSSATCEPGTERPPPQRRLVRRRTFADLVTQWALPALALGLLAFAAWFVRTTQPRTVDPAIVFRG